MENLIRRQSSIKRRREDKNVAVVDSHSHNIFLPWKFYASHQPIMFWSNLKEKNQHDIVSLWVLFHTTDSVSSRHYVRKKEKQSFINQREFQKHWWPIPRMAKMPDKYPQIITQSRWRDDLQQTLGGSCNYQEKLASFSACHIGSNTWRISGGCQYDWLAWVHSPNKYRKEHITRILHIWTYPCMQHIK